MAPLTLAFSFTLEDETVPVTEELVAASLGAARHKHPLGEPDQPFRREEGFSSPNNSICMAAWCWHEI